MDRCIVCGHYLGTYAIGIRARDRDANAKWAPNVEAHLCGEHAASGLLIEIAITPRADGRIRTVTRGPQGSVEAVLVIGTGRKEDPGQGTLL